MRKKTLIGAIIWFVLAMLILLFVSAPIGIALLVGEGLILWKMGGPSFGLTQFDLRKVLPKGKTWTWVAGIGLGLSLAYLGGVLLLRGTIPFNWGAIIVFGIVFFLSSIILREKIKGLRSFLTIANWGYGIALFALIGLNFFNPEGKVQFENTMNSPDPVITLPSPSSLGGSTSSTPTPQGETWLASEQTPIQQGPEVITLDKQTQEIDVPPGYQLCANMADNGRYQHVVTYTGGVFYSRQPECTDINPGRTLFRVGGDPVTPGGEATGLRYLSYKEKGIEYPFLKKK